jgi:hypothetical protein
VSRLSDDENDAVICFGRLVSRRASIVTFRVIVDLSMIDMTRSRRMQLFINVMYAMGRREDQEEQKRESGTPT